jgi:hypothetical protein
MRVPSAAQLHDDTCFSLLELQSWKKSQLKFIADNYQLERAADTRAALFGVVQSALSQRGKLEVAVSVAPETSPSPLPAAHMPAGNNASPPPPVSPPVLTAVVVQQIIEAALAHHNTVFKSILHESLATMEVRMHSKIDALTQDLKLHKLQLAAVQAQHSTMQDTCAALTAECSELRAGHASLTKMVNALQARTSSLQNDSERAERQHRGLNVILTGLPECDNETPALLEGQVHDVMAALKVPVGVKVQSFSRLGQKGRTYAEAAGGPSQGRPKIRPVVLRFACTQDKISALKGRVNLNKSDKFRRLGVNPDLTRSQQEKKTAAWPAFVKARQEGKKTWWVDDTLFINGLKFVPAVAAA